MDKKLFLLIKYLLNNSVRQINIRYIGIKPLKLYPFILIYNLIFLNKLIVFC